MAQSKSLTIKNQRFGILQFVFFFLFQPIFSQNSLNVLQLKSGDHYLSNATDGTDIHRWNALSQNLEFTYEGLKSTPIRFFQYANEIIAIDSSEVVIWDENYKDPKKRFPLPKDVAADLKQYIDLQNSHNEEWDKIQFYNNKIYLALGRVFIEVDYKNGTYKLLKEFESYIVNVSYSESASYFIIEENLFPKSIHHFDPLSGKFKLITQSESIHSSISPSGDFTIYNYYSKIGEIYSPQLKKKKSYSVNDYVGYDKPLFIAESILIFPFADSSAFIYNTDNSFCSRLGFSNGNGLITYNNGYFLAYSPETYKVSCLTFYQYISSREGFSQKAISLHKSEQIIKSGRTDLNSIQINGEKYSYSEPVTAITSLSDKMFFGASDGAFGIFGPNEQLVPFDKISNSVTSITATDSFLYIGSLGRIVTYNLNLKKFMYSFRAHEGFVKKLSLSPDKRFMLSIASDGKAFIWDLKEQSTIHSLWFPKTIETGSIENDLSINLVFSDGEVQKFNNAYLYDRLFSSQLEVKTRLGHRSSIRNMDLNESGEKLITVDEDGVIKIWMTDQMIPIHTLQFDDGIFKIKFIEQGNTFFAFSGTGFYIIDTKSGELIRTINIPSIYGNLLILDIVAANNGRFFYLTFVNSNDVYSYNLTTNSFSWFAAGSEPFSVKDVAVHPSDDSLFVTFGKDAVYILNTNNGDLINKIPNPNNSNNNAYVNYTLTFSPKGTLLMADYNDSLRVFDFKSRKLIGTYPGYLGFFPTDSTVFICAYSRQKNETLFRCENVYSKQIQFETKLDQFDFLSNQFSFDHKREILYISKNSEIKLINMRTGLFLEKQSGIVSKKIYAQFDPLNNGKLIVSLNHEIKTVNAVNGQTEKSWKIKGDKIVYTQDYSKMAISYKDFINVYSLPNEELLFKIPNANEFKFTNTGQLITFDYLDGVKIVNDQTGKEIYTRKSGIDVEILKSFVFVPQDKELVIIIYKGLADTKNMTFQERIEAMKKATFILGIDVISGKQKYLKEYPIEFTDMLVSSKGRLAMQTNYSEFKLTQNTGEVFISTDLFDPEFQFSEDGQYFYLKGDEGQLESYSTETGKLIFKKRIHDTEIIQLSWKDSLMLVVANDGKVVLANTDDGKLNGTYLFFDGDNHVMINAENYYKGTKKGVEGIYFKKGKNYYPIEQFDANRNRPDLVLKSFGEQDEDVLNSYKHAVEKRLNKIGLNLTSLQYNYALPELLVKERSKIPYTTSIDKITFELQGKSKDVALKSLHIWINDVPVFGTKGISESISGLNSFDKKVTLELAEGSNKIQIALMNEQGTMNEKQTFYINYDPVRAVRKNLYLINLGVSNYLDSANNLSYAAKDANDLGNLYMNSSSETFDSIFHFTLIDEELTTANTVALKSQLLKASRNDVVIISFAGHGLLDKDYNYFLATHNMDFKNPASKGLPYETLENLLDGIQPLKKALFIDACHSGEVDKDAIISNSEGVVVKNGGRGGKVAYTGDKTKLSAGVLSEELFNDLRRGTGATVVSASGGMELAMESVEWQNGLFTYTFIKGIKEMAADYNNDGFIMLSELQRYVQKEVFELSNGNQKPSSRIENLTLDFRIW